MLSDRTAAPGLEEMTYIEWLINERMNVLLFIHAFNEKEYRYPADRHFYF